MTEQLVTFLSYFCLFEFKLDHVSFYKLKSATHGAEQQVFKLERQKILWQFECLFFVIWEDSHIKIEVCWVVLTSDFVANLFF